MKSEISESGNQSARKNEEQIYMGQIQSLVNQNEKLKDQA